MRLYLAIAFVLCAASLLEAAPKRYAYEEETAILLRELRDGFDDMRHEVNNHESELRVFEEKLTTIEQTIDSLRSQVSEAALINKELVKENQASAEMKLNSLDSAVKGLIADFKQFKGHANDSSSVLGQYKQKMLEMEKLIESQNRNIENLQTALKSMMDAIQVKNSLDKPVVADASGAKTYRVKSGDSLEKIARANGVTTTAIKELNNLSNDRINIGQVLKLP